MSQTLFSQVCHRDVSMAIACFKSLERCWQQKWNLNLIEDGSMTNEGWDEIQAAFPTAVFHRKRKVKERIEETIRKYPACLSFYKNNVAAPKVLEGPLLSKESFHFCDPDLLFFRRIENLWPRGESPLFLSENHSGFSGFSHGVYHWAFRHRIPLAENINSGMIRLPAGFLDLEKTEWFLKRTENPRTPFVIEQTVWSFLVAKIPHLKIAPDDVLCTKGALPSKNLPLAIHFLANQKAHFWSFVPETLKYSTTETIPEPRTVEGRRITWKKIGTHVAKGFGRRIAEVISKKNQK